MTHQTWEKHLTVDRRIVRLLSASTYEDFPGAIRETVSNAYDADATEVDITINLKGDYITVIDNGNGMTPDDFDFFLRIAGQQRSKQESPQLGRKRIGQFGIGFLANFPFGKRIQVISTAYKSDIQFEATIPTEQFMKEGQRVIDVESIPIVGSEVHDKNFLDQHGTTIRISGLSEMIERYFQESKIPKHPGRLSSIRDLAPIERLEWILQEDLPLDYVPGSPYHEAFSDLGSSGIQVRLNKKQLFRNAVGSQILEEESWDHGTIKCRYAIATSWKSIEPSEARYFKQRLRNVGIGERTSFGLGFEGRAYSRLHWLSGEIRILEGFDNLISIDRAKFIDSPEYDQFREYFRGRLSHYANYVETVSEAQRDIKRQTEESRFAEVGARKEIINRNIGKLESRGFRVITKTKEQAAARSKPVTVDVKRKVVEVVEEHPALRDAITVGNKQIPIRYTTWDVKSQFPAVRRAEDGVIEVNTAFPVFKSRRYGDVFKRVLVLMLIQSEVANSPEDYFSKVSHQLAREFRDLS